METDHMENILDRNLNDLKIKAQECSYGYLNNSKIYADLKLAP